MGRLAKSVVHCPVLFAGQIFAVLNRTKFGSILTIRASLLAVLLVAAIRLIDCIALASYE